MPDRPETNDTGGPATAFAFLAGAALGAGLALLLAPRAGAETRRVLRTSLGEAEATLRTNLDRGLTLLEEARARLGEALDAGREAARREATRLRREWAAAAAHGRRAEPSEAAHDGAEEDETGAPTPR